MHPTTHAAARPDHPAIVMAGSGKTVSFGELDAAANRVAQLFRSRGLAAESGVVGLWLENRPEYLEIAWGNQRAGTTLVPISTHLTPDEVAYILEDSGATLLISSAQFAPRLEELARLAPDVAQLVFEGAPDAAEALAAMPAEPIADQSVGLAMLYSSGTTGRPKGIKPATPPDPDHMAVSPLIMLAAAAFGWPTDGSVVYLSPGPLYHAAPFRWSMTAQSLGGTVVVMEKFHPEAALAAIETYRVTDSQWVPTHFIRMLKLPEEARTRYDLSTHKRAIHAAAPCPVSVKHAMIDWWGPIILEYYAGSEGNGMTFANSQMWLDHPGSVGKPIRGIPHVCDGDGNEVPVGEEGVIFFEVEDQFEYHNDPVKTAEATHPNGWTTLGDIGKLDEDGFLYLTDRRSNMIISGGVNIYPQEIENLLITHPAVADAAVIGAPDPDMGERVVAVVQPADLAAAGEALKADLLDYLGSKLARLKLPREIEFRAELPREANGKLYKRKLKDEFRERAAEEA
ncbi:acyl-CoA synthetase [Tsuneonella amylolytica]|uniref:acyl-CoA synthetase n=1 Tax=Tsuneonella amylolytica TaxID=2338327 RepID=UPI000EA85993|nr:acyl-CoA synthetase [Tsuneonella amylolytica]